jgi:hypothetical protein
VLAAVPLDPGTPAGPAIAQAVRVLQVRLHAVVPGARVSASGSEIVIRGATATATATASNRARILALTAPGRIAFFDWEADALTPNGRTVAAQLGALNPAALAISQGGADGPGSATAGGGGLSLYAAVRLASRQPAAAVGSSLSRPGRQLYLFGTPGSAACTAAARDGGTLPVRGGGAHCLLAGPAASGAALHAGLPAGVALAQGQMLTVPQGTVVLEAQGAPVAPLDPSDHFFVLRDRTALSGAAVRDPRPGTDQAGQPDVALPLSPAGARAFTALTAGVARRGSQVSAVGHTFDQHLAVALDGRLVMVAAIAFRVYPDGITGAFAQSVQLSGDFTRATAATVSTLLRSGPLAVSLTPR